MDHGKPTKRDMLDNHINDNDCCHSIIKIADNSFENHFLYSDDSFSLYSGLHDVSGLRAHWIMALDWLNI